MNTFKKTLIATALLATGAAAQAEVSGSAGIATSYLFRGLDLSAGSAAFSGSLDYGHESGVYAGIWASSGDDSYGTEYDLYVGWGGDITEDFSLDLAYVDYNYPTCEAGNAPFNADPANSSPMGGCDFEEVILGLGYGPASLTVVENVTSGSNANYFALGYEVSDFSFTYGGTKDTGSDYTHFDATYSMGDLAFTVSKLFDKGVLDNSEETQFVVSYSIPLGE